MWSAPRARSHSGARSALSRGWGWVAAALVVGGLAACTSAQVGPTLTGTQAPATIEVDASPSPVLTPLDTLRCVVQRTLPLGQGGLPLDSIRRADATGAETQGPVETVPGADASRCPGALPTAVCDEPRPWSRPGDERFFTATRATLRVEGSATWSLVASPRVSGSAVATGVKDLQSVGYGLLRVRPSDPARALAYLERSARQCERATSVTLGSRRVLVGTVTSQFRQGPATVVLLPGPNAAAWLLLDGTTQLPESELVRIVEVAASRLLPS